MEDFEFEFDYDDDGEETDIYYILGENPIKVTCIDSFPARAETPDLKTKTFVTDNSIIKHINDSADVIKVSETDFINFCLSRGIKPI